MLQKYHPHFYDPVRLEIAISQIQHDFRKLFPSLRAGELKRIDQDIAGWPSGKKYELEPIHDFWNFFGHFARGLKFKSMLSWLTAENVHWAKESVPIEKVIVTWDFPGLEFMGRAPYSAKEIKSELNKPDLLKWREAIKEESDWRENRYEPREQFPVVLFDDVRGGIINPLAGFQVLEGNRRVVRGILNDYDSIQAYVGRFINKNDRWPINYWVGTGILGDLVFFANLYEKEKDSRAFKTVREFFQLLMRDFDVARFVAFNRAFKLIEKSDRLIKEIMTKDY